ncbi:Uncharacterized protein Rs2_14189 [Raphanus sativus]|nr:Uncharacterized protein Rs2_14189 [Raphanus sativus]
MLYFADCKPPLTRKLGKNGQSRLTAHGGSSKLQPTRTDINTGGRDHAKLTEHYLEKEPRRIATRHSTPRDRESQLEKWTRGSPRSVPLKVSRLSTRRHREGESWLTKPTTNRLFRIHSDLKTRVTEKRPDIGTDYVNYFIHNEKEKQMRQEKGTYSVQRTVRSKLR